MQDTLVDWPIRSGVLISCVYVYRSHICLAMSKYACMNNCHDRYRVINI